jgi:hypothetical protein
MFVKRLFRMLLTASILLVPSLVSAQSTSEQKAAEGVPYLNLTPPRHVLLDAQAWEGNEFPHTMSVLEFNRGGFRYWGWYGLNEGRGVGLARSNDLLHWTKYEKNPLWTNARWPSVLANADPQKKDVLYFAITREYDTPSSHIVLATSTAGVQLTEVKILVAGVPNQRNQNPNLFRDPRSGRFYLTYYRGNDKDQFQIISRNASSLLELDKAPEKVLLRTTQTLAAPTLLYLPRKGKNSGIYYMATEIYPHRYTTDPQGEWQVKVFAADAPDGDFQPVVGNPIETGQRACLFQHIFNGRFYGYQCHLEPPDHWMLEEVEASLP